MGTYKAPKHRGWFLGLRMLLASVIAFGPAVPAFAVSLKDIPVVEPTNLHAFVKGTPGSPEAVAAKESLVVLGKALFWDMQVGSDDVQACASCHFNAGADPRPTNQLNPGGLEPNATADTVFGNSTMPGIPGANQAPWNFGFGANTRLLANHFPFHLRQNPTEPMGLDDAVGTLRDTNDVSSSQGVREGDLPFPFNDGVFNSGGANQRRVEPRNAPTMINAAFSLDMFWDGRASFIFNGQNPFGFRDRDARITQNQGTAGTPDLQQVRVRIPFASHASQSVGPPLSHFEMAGTFRTFPELADKMLDPNTTVMGLQVVHPEDSVLGPYAKAGYLTGNSGELDDVPGMESLVAPGTDLTYLELIQSTFRDEWWNGGPTHVRENFALFFGLSMQAYQGTLIADDTPLDRFLGTDNDVRGGGGPIPPAPTALTQQELLGLDIFQGTNLSGQNFDPNAVPDPLDPLAPLPGLVNGACINCHILPETTNHTVRLAGAQQNIAPFAPQGVIGLPTDLENVVVPNAVIEPMPFGAFAPVDPAVLVPFLNPVTGQFDLTPQFFIDNPGFLAGFGLYDVGFYNLGVRPTGEDLGRGVNAPATTGFPGGLPLAYVDLADMLRDGTLDPVTHADVAQFVPPIPPVAQAVEIPLTDGTVAIVNGIPTAGVNPITRGAFKVPNLRNQEFQGPYFHNGGNATLRQVVEFYARGGDFPNTNMAHLDADLGPIPGLDVNAAPLPGSTVTAEERIEALVAFLSHALTDQRVAMEAAPFDHPQLIIPEGANGRAPESDRAFESKATGANGAESSIPRFLGLNPQVTGDPTELGRISGRVTADGSGTAIPGITVTAYHQPVQSGPWETASVAMTDGGGFYTLPALNPGSYKIRFTDELGEHVPETYDDAPFALAVGVGTDVTVTADTVTPNINASLAVLATDSFEPDDSMATAKSVAGDVTQQRTLTVADQDWIRIDGRAGTLYTFETAGDIPVDTYLQLFSADNTQVAANNDGGAGTFSRITYTAPADGNLFLKVRGANAGAAGPYSLTLNATDITPPTTTSNAVGTYQTPATINLAATDDWSGVKLTQYRVDGGPWTIGTVVSVAALGQHTVDYRSVDNADNTEQIRSASFNVVAIPTVLNATTTASQPKYGKSVVVSAKLRRGTSAGTPLAGQKVRLESSANGKKWATIATLTTNGAGEVSRTRLPRTTRYYRFVYDGTAGLYLGKTSNSVKIVPGVSVTRPSGPSVARPGSTFTSTGYLKPKHKSGTKPVVVKAYRLESGKWVYKKGFNATASNYRSYTKYSAKVKLAKGVWRIRTHHRADALNSSTYTGYRYLVVR